MEHSNHITSSLGRDALQNRKRLSQRQWDSLFRLFGMVLVSSGDVTNANVTEYRLALTELKSNLDASVYITSKMIDDHIAIHKDEYRSELASLSDDYLYDLLSALRPLPLKLDIVTMLVKIAIANGTYTLQSKSIIKKTILHWHIGVNQDFDTIDRLPETLSVAIPATE